jgi:hypothetical protein
MEFMSTHPSDSRRSASLREQLAEALQVYDHVAHKYALGEPINK